MASAQYMQIRPPPKLQTLPEELLEQIIEELVGALAPPPTADRGNGNGHDDSDIRQALCSVRLRNRTLCRIAWPFFVAHCFSEVRFSCPPPPRDVRRLLGIAQHPDLRLKVTKLVVNLTVRQYYPPSFYVDHVPNVWWPPRC